MVAVAVLLVLAAGCTRSLCLSLVEAVEAPPRSAIFSSCDDPFGQQKPGLSETGRLLTSKHAWRWGEKTTCGHPREAKILLSQHRLKACVEPGSLLSILFSLQNPSFCLHGSNTRTSFLPIRSRSDFAQTRRKNWFLHCRTGVVSAASSRQMWEGKDPHSTSCLRASFRVLISPPSGGSVGCDGHVDQRQSYLCCCCCCIFGVCAHSRHGVPQDENRSVWGAKVSPPYAFR